MDSLHLQALVERGRIEKHAINEVFHSLDFKERFYHIKSGYVKRYSINANGSRIIESVYGPGYFFPLSPVYSLFDFNLNEDSSTYIYQAMTDVAIQGINLEELESGLKKTPEIYAELFLEAGRRLKANINRLASNALKSPSKKMAHLLANLGEEFGDLSPSGKKDVCAIKVPLRAVDLAEQLNITTEAAQASLDKLTQRGLIQISGSTISVPDMDLLRDIYL